jgi:hypothetical protein
MRKKRLLLIILIFVLIACKENSTNPKTESNWIKRDLWSIAFLSNTTGMVVGQEVCGRRL